MKLSRAQRELLAELVSYPYGEGRITGRGQRTADVLKRHGLIKWAGGGDWVKVTPEGHAVSRERS